MTPYYADSHVTLYHADVRAGLAALPDESVQCCVTSPPYWGLRDYGTATWEGGNAECDHIAPATGATQNKGNNGRLGTPYRASCGDCGAVRIDAQIGLESTPDAYVAKMVEVFREVRRVLANDGTLWLNLGSSYASSGGATPGTRSEGIGQANVGDGLRRASTLRSARACGSDGIGLRDSSETDFACPDLCDGCRVVLSQGSASTFLPPASTPSPDDTIGRDSERWGSGVASPDALRLDVPASTTTECASPPSGACSHCGNCGACLAVLRSSSRDGSLCAHTDAYTNGNAPHASARHSLDMNAEGMAWLKYTYKPKDLVPIPWLVAMALQRDGWYLRSDIIWHKPNPMPESVTDRPTKSHEYLFLLSKSERYSYDADAIAERASEDSGFAKQRAHGVDTWAYGRTAGGNTTNGVGGTFGTFGMRNRRSVWTVATKPYAGAHFATFPPDLITPCILAGCPEGGTVLDPFGGSGTTGHVAKELGRKAVLIELNAAYCALTVKRLPQEVLDFGGVA